MYKDYSKYSLAELRLEAKSVGMVRVTGFKKAELAQLLTEIQAKKVIKQEQEGNNEPIVDVKAKEEALFREIMEGPIAVKEEYTSAVDNNQNVFHDESPKSINVNTQQKREGNTSNNTTQSRRSQSDSNQNRQQNRPQNKSNQNNAQARRPQTDTSNGADRNAKAKKGEDLQNMDRSNVVRGILEVLPDGFGFIRGDNYMPGENDVYVSPTQIKRFDMRTGDIIEGNIRFPKNNEKFGALLQVRAINDDDPANANKRPNFEELTPIFPNERLRLETVSKDYSTRLIDFIAPIGKGQRGMIVSPPKAGKTTLLKRVANSITKNYPDIYLLVLLIDERPEEVTDIKRSITGEKVEVIHSTFDELPEHHKRVSEMVLARAKRMVEEKKDLVILLDSITRLARAYNLIIPPSGRTLSGGLDPAALYMPKKFFGAARNIEEGGSLTVLATALVDTGSKMDDMVFEEFKGTGNMELVLDRKLSEKRIFPAIDVTKSGTRRDDLLYDKDEMEAVNKLRKVSSNMRSEDVIDSMLKVFVNTSNNKEYVKKLSDSILENY